jgi:hypothetical protein
MVEAHSRDASAPALDAVAGVGDVFGEVGFTL